MPQVVVTARRQAELDKVAETVDAIAVPADLTFDADLRHLVDGTIELFGKIDVPINNASTAASVPALSMDLDTFRSLLEWFGASPVRTVD